MINSINDNGKSAWRRKEAPQRPPQPAASRRRPVAVRILPLPLPLILMGTLSMFRHIYTYL